MPYKNIEERKRYHKKYRKEHSEYFEQYRKDNRERKNEVDRKYKKLKRKIDLKYKINDRMGIGIYKSLRKNKKHKHWETFVDYTLKDLIKHLKKTIPESYTWQDYLEGRLHIDHKIPKSAFNFDKPEHPDFKRCWALSNLQLLPAKENRIKHNKLSRPFQPALQIY